MTDVQGARLWALHPILDVPDLRPCAVQCAIFDQDPRVRWSQRLSEYRSSGRSEPADRLAHLGSLWDLAFMDLTGEKVFLLEDFGEPPALKKQNEQGQEIYVVRKASVGIMSNGPEGRKWLVTKVVQREDERYCWCLPFEARAGSPATLRLDRTNWIRLGVDLVA